MLTSEHIAGFARDGFVTPVTVFDQTRVRQTKLRDTAVLVAGADDFGHFDLLGPPKVEFGRDELALQTDALQRMQRALHSDGPPPPRAK